MPKVSKLFKLLEMASYNRKTFDEKLTGKIAGSLSEYPKFKMASLNHQSKWQVKWKNEVKRLIEVEAKEVYLSPIKGFSDREKVLQKVIKDFKKENGKGTYTRYGINAYTRYYGKKPKNQITEDMINTYLDQVYEYLVGVDDTFIVEAKKSHKV